MSKTFRAWDVDQSQFFPASVHDFVPRGHEAHFIRELVRNELDLSSIVGSYAPGPGQPPYHPVMMVSVLLYGCVRGVYSSRRIARACVERVDFMAVTGLEKPDFRTISEFRRRHLDALAGLFVQVLRLAETAGLVGLGHVALDGTKVRANASKHKAMSYAHMNRREAELAAEVGKWLEAAEAADAEEDALYGSDRRGDEMPDWMSDKQKRLEKIREAKAALEAEARAEAEAKAKDPPKYRGGRKPKTPPGEPRARAQTNFTDPESRIMKTRDGFIQGYNGQAAVDAGHQIIVAQTLTQSASDQRQLTPLVDGIEANLGVGPKEVSADAGYCSEPNLEALEARGIRGYVATGRAKHPAGGGANKRGPRVEAMRTRLRRGGRRSRYRLRKQVVEPVFGQIKQARGFRQFLLRGIEKVTAEWAIICTAHNLTKLRNAAAA
ncbi:MAG: IS1182 family transposase [Hyphomicrobiales bacterium]|nr:IS1182 family transposase [Hyphomicrobiales bacterium]